MIGIINNIVAIQSYIHTSGISSNRRNYNTNVNCISTKSRYERPHIYNTLNTTIEDINTWNQIKEYNR